MFTMFTLAKIITISCTSRLLKNNESAFLSRSLIPHGYSLTSILLRGLQVSTVALVWPCCQSPFPLRTCLFLQPKLCTAALQLSWAAKAGSYVAASVISGHRYHRHAAAAVCSDVAIPFDLTHHPSSPLKTKLSNDQSLFAACCWLAAACRIGVSLHWVRSVQ